MMQLTGLSVGSAHHQPARSAVNNLCYCCISSPATTLQLRVVTPSVALPLRTETTSVALLLRAGTTSVALLPRADNNGPAIAAGQRSATTNATPRGFALYQPRHPRAPLATSINQRSLRSGPSLGIGNGTKQLQIAFPDKNYHAKLATPGLYDPNSNPAQARTAQAVTLRVQLRTINAITYSRPRKRSNGPTKGGRKISCGQFPHISTNDRSIKISIRTGATSFPPYRVCRPINQKQQNNYRNCYSATPNNELLKAEITEGKMPTPGRRNPTTYKPAQYYLDRIPILHSQQQRLTDQLKEIFRHNEEGDALTKRIKEELTEGLLVSPDVVSNPKVYRFLREAVESRGIPLLATVQDTIAGSFVAKRIIAAIWSTNDDKVKRDSLLMEYHNARQAAVISNKDIVSQDQSQGTSTRLSGVLGASSSTSRPPEEIAHARQTLERLNTEEARANTGTDDEEDFSNAKDSSDEDQQPQIHTASTPQYPITPAAQLGFLATEIDAQADNANSAADDRNITRRARPESLRIPLTLPISTNPPGMNQRNNTTTPAPQDVRTEPVNAPATDTNSTNELVAILAKVLDRLTNDNRQANPLSSPDGNHTSWNDPKDIKRKARKSISSQFNKRMFSGKFGDNWDRHLERFLKACTEWEIPPTELTDYLQETVTGDALNYIEGKLEENPNITWIALTKLLAERYNNINRQKETSDRLYSMRYNDFLLEGESPSTTLDRITAYIDKMAVLALPVDRTDEAKARFVSNVTRGQIWAYHAKGRIAPTASYDRVVQAFATSIRDRAELETGRNDRGSSSRREYYRRSELYNLHKKRSEDKKSEVFSDDEVFFADDLDEPLTAGNLATALDTYFENAKFATNPRSLRSTAGLHKHVPSRQRSGFNNPKNFNATSAASAVGCFNCGKQGCSVATCPRPRDAKRIAQNITRWKQLRRMDKAAKINLTNVPALCKDPYEANEVMVAAIFCNQYQDESEPEEETTVDPLKQVHDELRCNASHHAAHGNESSCEDDEQDKDQIENLFNIGLISNITHSVTDVLIAHNKRDIPAIRSKYTQTKFAGACLDTGAQRSVCGLSQAQAYSNEHPGSFSATESNVRFRFGEQVVPAIGLIRIRIPITASLHLDLAVDVVDLDIPLILGLDILRGKGLLVDYINNELKFCNHDLSLPITSKYGHVFLEWDYHTIHFTKTELIRLHTHFMHPSASKLYDLIARANPEKASPSIKRLINEITDACTQCKTYASAPLRFKASIPSDRITFNQVVSVDLLWLYDRAVLHVIDEHTGFRNAAFLKSKSSKDIWNAFMGCWVTTYVGFPQKLRSDQESATTSNEFRACASLHGIEIEFSGVSSHNSMGKIESAHGPLRRIYRMLTDKYPDLSDALRLRFSVKALNDTSGPKGLVPSLLVFGTIPSIGSSNANLPDQEQRFKAMRAAREEAATIFAEQRIRIALKSNAPPSSKYMLKPGQEVKVFSEKQKKWVEGIRLVQLSSKQAWVNYRNRIFKVSRAQVIPHKRSDDQSGIAELLRMLSPLNSQSHPNILLTEILQPNDNRAESPGFELAKAKEIVGLLDRGAFRIVLREEIDPQANVLGGRFVLTIKNKDTDNEIFKARFVVQGHLDKEKELLVHTSSTVSQQATRLLVSLATIMGFRLWSEDINLAYIQGAEQILRKVYVKGKPEFQLKANQLLEILRPLYGLSDSGDYWHATFLKHLKNDLEMYSTACDLSLFFKHVQGSLQGLLATHVDDTLSAGNKAFEESTQVTSQRFDAKPREYENLTFAGVTIKTNPDGSRMMHQAQYAKKIETVEKKCTFERFRSRRHELAWITHTRPDIAAEAAMLAQVTRVSFSPNHVTQLNRAIRRVKAEPELGLTVHKLKPESLQILVHADASFANLPDLKTQLGFVVLLTDETNRVNWLHFRSYKCKRVVRSVLAGETHAFADAFDAAYAIRHDLVQIIRRYVPLNMVTDSDSLFKVIVQSSHTTERRLMIDIQAGREAYQAREIDNIGWVRSDGNLADGLTKVNKVDLIQTVMRTGKLVRVADQWVIRPPTPHLGGTPDVRADNDTAPAKAHTKREPATAGDGTKEEPTPFTTSPKAKLTMV